MTDRAEHTLATLPNIARQVFLRGGTELGTRTAPGFMLSAGDVEMTAARENIHVGQSPEDRYVLGHTCKKMAVVQETRNPMQINDVAFG